MDCSKIDVLSFGDDPNWWKAEMDGKEGYIPSNYIDLKPHEWFKGDASRQIAESLLLEKICDNQYIQEDGAFLIRPSESAPGDLSLSVKFGDLVHHYRVLRDGAGKYFLWVVKFDSVNQLIKYHRTSSVSRSDTLYLKDMNWKVAIALYDFTPDDASEINVKKGDDLKIEDGTRDTNWWRGRNLRTNQSGLFPANYVKVYKVASGSTEQEDLVTHTVGK